MLKSENGDSVIIRDGPTTSHIKDSARVAHLIPSIGDFVGLSSNIHVVVWKNDCEQLEKSNKYVFM